MKALFVIFAVILSISCSSENSNSQSSETSFSGEFNLLLSNGKGFTHQSKKFKTINATIGYLEFKSFGWQIRFSASKLEDTAPTSSTDLVYNNTFVSFYQDVKGKRTKIFCRPKQNPVGQISIADMSDNTFSGEFEFEVVKCRNFYTEEIIEEIKVPIQVKGNFKNIIFKDHLAELLKKRNLKR